MFKYIYWGELMHWKIIVVDLICISICFEYIVYLLKKLKTNFCSKLPLKQDTTLCDKVRMSVFIISVVCASPMVSSWLACCTIIILLCVMVYLYKKDETKQYAKEIKDIVKNTLISGVVIVGVTILRVYNIF